MDTNAAKVVHIGGEIPTNDASDDIQSGAAYRIAMQIRTDADLLLHRYSPDAVIEKNAAKKNSKAKKEDNIESYVYRNDDGVLCIPGEYLRQSIIHAARSHADPRSPRKSARDMFTAGLVCLTHLAPLGVTEWDYLDTRRAVVQRNAIPRVRPAMRAGVELDFVFQVLVPEYITPSLLHAVATDAGRLVGIGDFRPTYGRFSITQFMQLRNE